MNTVLVSIFGLIFFALLAAAISWWGAGRLSFRRQQAESLFLLDTTARFYRQLLGAVDAQAIIRAAMQAGMTFLNARGASFLHFNEWSRSFSALTIGQVPVDPNNDWNERLLRPSNRQACKLCEKRVAGTECVLLTGTEEQSAIQCVPLRQAEREIGVLSLYFSRQPVLSDLQHAFLAEIVPAVDMALESVRKRQETSLEETGSVYQAILDERARLGREIHDGLAQTLAFLKMEAVRMQTLLEQGQTDRLQQTLQGYLRTLSDAYLDARQAIDDLRWQPDTTELPDWLKGVAANFEALTGIPVNVHIDPKNLPLSPPVNAQLVRIVQEALTNVRKHSQAEHVNLHLVSSGEHVLLEIQDDGRGFTPMLGLSRSQYGLRGMRERAESIGADFQVISRLGGGTTVQVRLPVHLQEAS